MSKKSEILAANTGGEMTRKQGGLLFRLTHLKFWEPERKPVPTVGQASILITIILDYNKSKDVALGMEIVECINIWFPEFDDIAEIKPGFKRNRKTPFQPSPEPEPEPESEPESKPKPKPKPTPKPKPKPTPKYHGKNLEGKELIQAMITAGLRNLWMVGPAGCGKTTICELIGDDLDFPVTPISCGAGTSATEFLGYKYPEREGNAFVHAFAQPGIIILDEFTALEPQVAQVANSALANGFINATIGRVNRHEDCIIVATSNTFGQGADRLYVSNNQLDASTLNRFAGSVVKVDYSKEYESQYDNEVCNYVWRLREIAKTNGLRKVISTRDIINACMLKDAGLQWKELLVEPWSDDEKRLIR